MKNKVCEYCHLEPNECPCAEVDKFFKENKYLMKESEKKEETYEDDDCA